MNYVKRFYSSSFGPPTKNHNNKVKDESKEKIKSFYVYIISLSIYFFSHNFLQSFNIAQRSRTLH